DTNPFVALFSESTARALVSVPRGHEKAFTALCAQHGLPATVIGTVDGRSRALDVRGQFTISLDELRSAWKGTLPALFGDVSTEAPTYVPPAAAAASSAAPASGPSTDISD